MYFKKQLQGTHKPNIYTRYTHTKENKAKHKARVSHQITGEQKREERKKPTKKLKRIKKMVTETDISIISLTGNGLKPMKRQTG